MINFRLNLLKDNNDTRDHLFSSVGPKFETSLPSFIDHSPQMSPVKNQGILGSCVGFAVTAVKEWQEQQEHIFEVQFKGKRDRRKHLSDYDLSEQWLYYHCKEIDPWPGEQGTSIRYAMKVLQKIGIPVEDGWAYNDLEKGNPKSWAKLVARWNTIESYQRITTVDQLKGALVNGPVPVGVALFEEINYVGSSGIIPYPANVNRVAGGHAIAITSFDDSRKLFKFKNSWSTEWGEGGYGYLGYSYIRDFLWDAWVVKDHSVTSEMFKESFKG